MLPPPKSAAVQIVRPPSPSSEKAKEKEKKSSPEKRGGSLFMFTQKPPADETGRHAPEDMPQCHDLWVSWRGENRANADWATGTASTRTRV